MARSSPEWDLNSDEIASVASEDLFENRPNRWTGPRSTWRGFTKEERYLWQSMKALEDRDLAIHLYNAHALKRRGKDPETAQDVTVTMENGQEGIWAPPKVWTAWPLSEDRLPENKASAEHGPFDDDGDNEDGDDGAGDDWPVYRLQEKSLPSSDLQEELFATVLRMAKERLYRERARRSGGDPEVKPSVEESEHDPISSGGSDDDMERRESDDDDDTSPKESRIFEEPVPSTNDELSHRLVKQPVRHILTQLDNTLRILHNSRMTTMDHASGSSATSDLDDSDSQRSMSGTPVSRRRRRRRSRSHISDAEGSGSASHASRASQSEASLSTGSKKRLSVTAAHAQKDAAFQAWLREGDERMSRTQSVQRDNDDDDNDDNDEMSTSSSVRASKWRARRLGLRDWSDVVGAAALAGFSPQVIARTTRRCAALFGESMTIRRLDEVPSSSRQPAFLSTDYHPEPILLLDDDDDDDDDDENDEEEQEEEEELSFRSSRQSSTEHRRSRGRGRETASSPSRSRSRSRSRSCSSIGGHFCPIYGCERAGKGFARRPNLIRHMRLVHPGKEDAAEQDSEDEALGAVHVDGFLKPILPSKGWREAFSPRGTRAADLGLKKSVSPLPPPVLGSSRRTSKRPPSSFSMAEDDYLDL